MNQSDPEISVLKNSMVKQRSTDIVSLISSLENEMSKFKYSKLKQPKGAKTTGGAFPTVSKQAQGGYGALLDGQSILMHDSSMLATSEDDSSTSVVESSQLRSLVQNQDQISLGQDRKDNNYSSLQRQLASGNNNSGVSHGKNDTYGDN